MQVWVPFVVKMVVTKLCEDGQQNFVSEEIYIHNHLLWPGFHEAFQLSMVYVLWFPPIYKSLFLFLSPFQEEKTLLVNEFKKPRLLYIKQHITCFHFTLQVRKNIIIMRMYYFPHNMYEYIINQWHIRQKRIVQGDLFW